MCKVVDFFKGKGYQPVLTKQHTKCAGHWSILPILQKRSVFKKITDPFCKFKKYEITCHKDFRNNFYKQNIPTLLGILKIS